MAPGTCPEKTTEILTETHVLQESVRHGQPVLRRLCWCLLTILVGEVGAIHSPNDTRAGYLSRSGGLVHLYYFGMV